MKKKIISIVSIFVLLSLALTNIVLAASVTLEAAPSTTALKEGETVTINLKVSKIDAGENGINTFGGKLTYDENIFEPVTQSSFEGKNNWSIAYNSENTDKKGTFLATNSSNGIKEDQIFATLTLKVKTKLKSTSAKVQFTELTSATSTEEIKVASQTVTLQITGTVVDPEPENPDQNNNVVNNNNIIIKPQNTINSQNNKPTNVGGNMDNTKNEGKLPQTGTTEGIFLIGLGAIAIGAIAAYIGYRKSNIK